MNDQNMKLNLNFTTDIFSDGDLADYLKTNTSDPWKGTLFEGYVHMGAKQKGAFGEMFVEKIMKSMGHEVTPAPTSTAGHDRVVNGIPTEIKFSLATRNKTGGVTRNSCIINHMSKSKDWKRLVFVCINAAVPTNPDDWLIRWFTHDDFCTHLQSTDTLFSSQQGGQKGGNDDYMCSGAKVKKLIDEEFVKTLDQF